MNVLVLAPHPDDETIGCGGAICLHVQRRERVVAVFLTSGELGLKHLPLAQAWDIRGHEARRAGKILELSELHFLRQPDWQLGDGIQKAAAALRPILKSETPNRIYLPHPQEWHPDHQAALPVLRAAFKGARIIAPELWCYEVWTPI